MPPEMIAEFTLGLADVKGATSRAPDAIDEVRM